MSLEVEKVTDSHTEITDLVERNRDFFQSYVRGTIKFEIAPKDLDTFVIDLNTRTIYISPRFLKDKGFDAKESASLFAVLHECEHFKEILKLLSEPEIIKNGFIVQQSGGDFFKVYLGKLDDGAYNLMDNSIADMRENTAVVSNAPTFSDLVPIVYRDNLYIEKDYRGKPLHIQFIEGLAREFQVKDERVMVDDEVREEMEKIYAIKNNSGVSLLDIMANPDLPMSERIKLQDKYIWPVVLNLRKKDIERKDKEDKDRNDEKNESGDEETGDVDRKGSKSDGGDEIKPRSTNPNDIFENDYKKANEKGFGRAVPTPILKEEFEKWVEENGKEVLKEKEMQKRADELGVSKEALKNYIKIMDELKVFKNKEGDFIIEEMLALLSKIISKREKPKKRPRYPLEDGSILIDPVGAVVGVSSGNLRPAIFGDFETVFKKGSLFGEVEITLICDRSGSMSEPIAKMLEQRKALVFMLDCIRVFNQELIRKSTSLVKPLKIKGEVFTFQADTDDTRAVIDMTDDLSERDCVKAVEKISTTPGKDTTDYVTLEAINKGLLQESVSKIKSGELKKIVIVFTDGESGDKLKVEKQIKSLVSNGIVVCGIGITESGESATATYALNGKVAKVATDLVEVLKDLLKEHLKDI